MRINDLIAETEQLDELTAADVGRGVGKVAKGVGAVAGGVAGAWDAAKKGFQGGRATVAGGGDPAPEAPAPTTAQDINAQGPTGTAPAKAVGGAVGSAIQKTAQALTGKTDAQTSQAIYSQIKSQIDQLDPKGKKQIIQLLQKSLAQQPAATPKAPAPQAAEPQAAAPAAQEPAATPAPQAVAEPAPQAAPAQQAAAPQAAPTQQAAAPQAEPAAQQTGGKLTAAQQAAMKAKLQGQRAAGKTAGTTASGFNQYTKDASSQRIVGANPDGSPKIQQIKASKINLGNNLSEALAQKVELQKRKMFDESLANGAVSVFKK